jgi:hypothetical protein
MTPLTRGIVLALLAGTMMSAPSQAADPAPLWPPLIERAAQPDNLVSFADPSKWIADGPKIRFDNDTVTLEGSGLLKLKAGLLSTNTVAPFSRLLVDYFIDGGPASDLGLAVKGFPQIDFSGRAYPRWATVDVTWPTGRWVTCSYDLNLCEWPGASADMFESGDAALTFIHTPGGLTTTVRMRKPLFVRDAFRIAYDWLPPYEPLTFTTEKDGTLRYSRTFTLVSQSDRPVTVDASTVNSAPAFQPRLEPARLVLPPHGTGAVVFTARSASGMTPLQHERAQVWFRESGKPETAQVRSFLLAAPARLPDRPVLPVPPMPVAPVIEQAMARELRMPPGPAWWMGQSDLNRFARMKEVAFNTFRDPETGEVFTNTAHASGTLHRRITEDIQALTAAYANTGKLEYAKKVRDWLVLYAMNANDYPITPPLMEATCALCPNNATYVQASVIVGPMMKALTTVWKSAAFTPEDRTLIHRQFILPRCLESMKINPGMSNMQDEINNMLFFAGLAAGDPNLIAEGLFGDHGLQAKINLSFASDGSTEESIAAGYHNGVVRIVSTLADAVLATGIDTGLSFDRLGKARSLLDNLAMPDGRVPNRGDTPTPGGAVTNADLLPSLTFNDFGMSVLREGRGSNAVYVALDHRPPATTHSHQDKLSIVLYGGGRLFGCDEGSLYNIDAGTSANVPDWNRRGAWGFHSLCHNTLTVDKKNQHYGGGHLLYFQGDDSPVRAVGAYTDNVFDGVRFERHLALRNGVLIVVDRLFSQTNRTYDLTHHSFGVVTSDVPMQPTASLGPEPMYSLPVDVKQGAVPGGRTGTVSWEQDGARMQYQVVNIEAQPLELFTATGWANVAYQNVRQPAPFLMARKTGKTAVFLSVINFGAHPVKINGFKAGPDRLEVPLPGGRIVFDFKANRVSVK